MCDTVRAESPFPYYWALTSGLGERTPVKARMTEYIPSHWQICHVARQFRAAVAGPGVRETLEIKRVVERKDGTFDYGEWYATLILCFALFLTCLKIVPTPSSRISVARYIFMGFYIVEVLSACLAVYL